MSHTLRECLLLIPSSGLDDFPEALPANDSAQLLSGWLALWHPSLIGLTHGAPRWLSANQPPHSFEGVLAVAPDCTNSHLPSDLLNTATNAGGWLIKPDKSWRELQSDIIAKLEVAPETPLLPQLQTEFAALGFAYLQIQLLTQKLRYTSNLDQVLFDSQVDQAASAALGGDLGQAEQYLQSCFDQLGQERDHYYSLDVSLLDVTLLAETTLGQTVTRQLARPLPTTFVASASLLRQMQARHPEVAAELQKALQEKTASLAGGLDVERPHPLMTFDTLKRDLERGRMAYEQMGFAAPTVFTRFTFGQVSDMPLHLRRSGYAGTMLIAWQDGSYPSGSHAKFSWEAAEGTFINAIAPPLVDAQSPETYLTFGRRIAEALDHQHVPVFMMAHWPNQYSEFFELLACVVRRTPALGRWQHVDDFFEKTDQPYHQDHLPGRKFAHDWAAATGHQLDDLIDRSTAYHRLAGEARMLQNILNLSYQLENFHRRPRAIEQEPANSEDPNRIAAYAERGPQAVPLTELDAGLCQALDEIDRAFDKDVIAAGHLDKLNAEIARLRSQIDARFARAAGHRPADNATLAQSPMCLLVNPSSTPQRLVHRSATNLGPVANGGWLYATGCDSTERLSMIDLPGFGMLPVAMQPVAVSPKRREPTLVQGDGLLVNDFMEIQIDPRSGALRSLHVPGKRGNRLSMQVARRERVAGQIQTSQMQLNQLQTLENSTVRGAIRARGTCVLNGQPTGDFDIEYELLRGQRVLNVTVKLSGLTALSGSPWSSAYVLRTAWPSEASIVTGRSCSSRQTIPAGKAVATEWIEMEEVEYRTYLLTGGLPFHQRVEERFMETLLGNGSSGHLQRCFGVGIDLPSATATASQFGISPHIIAIQSPSASPPGDAAWLMHIDAKNVLMQLESPLRDAEGHCAGLRVHISELAGKSVTARLRALREVREAHRVDYHGNRIAKLTVEGDTVSIAVRPHEMTFVDLQWA